MKKLFTFIAFCLFAMARAQSPLVISEIMYNPPEAGDDTLEYLEITNLSNQPYSLVGHFITSGIVDTFGVNDVIPANGYFITAKQASSFNIVFGFTPHQWKSGSLNNGGETITLTSPSGATLSSVDFGDSGAGWPAEADGSGYSMEMCDLFEDINNPSNWGKSGTNTGININNFDVYGTPGELNTATCGPLVNPNTVIVANFSFTPDEITINEGETVTWKFEDGTHNVNGDQSVFSNNPESFRSGEPTSAPYEFSYTFNTPGDYDYRCDLHTSMRGKVHVIPDAPAVVYHVRTIGQIDGIDEFGAADSLGKKVEVTGVVYGVNMRTTGISSTIIDGSRDGIGIFNSNETFGYTVKEGDRVTVRGTVDQFNGLTQILLDTIWVNDSNNTLHAATQVSDIDESTESDLVLLTGMSLVDPGQWLKGTTFNASITNGTITVVMRVVSTTTLSSQDAPVGTFSVKGLGGQFDPSSPYNEGYQLLPRYKEDVSVFASTKNTEIAAQVNLFPSPVENELFLASKLNIQKIELINANGNVINSQSTHLNRVNTSSLNPGPYWLRITTSEGSGTKGFLKI